MPQRGILRITFWVAISDERKLRGDLNHAGSSELSEWLLKTLQQSGSFTPALDAAA
jgi:hypothetical protein